MIASLQLQFGASGNWGDYLMIALWQGADGARRQERYLPADVEASGLAPALQAVVAALVGLGEQWQARQVWARLHQRWCEPDPESSTQFEPHMAEWIELDVEAQSTEHGGRWRFSSRDYSRLRVTDAAAIEFFKHFTHNHTHDNG